MKNKTLRLTILRHSLIGALHWYVTSPDGRVLRRCNRYEDARRHALKLAYAKNITVYE